MSKIITFSRVFPSYHPKKGKATFFIEAILNDLGIDYTKESYYNWLVKNNPKISPCFLKIFFNSLVPVVYFKSQTIRSHKKPLKTGDFITPKCWAGKPYNKTKEGFWQIKFAPDIKIVNTWQFEMDINGVYAIDSKYLISEQDDTKEIFLAKNDGFKNPADLFHWLMPNYKKPKEFKGYILCWNKKVFY